MFIATTIVCALLAAALVGSAASKLAGAATSVVIRDRLGVTATRWKTIGGLELAAAAGLLAGLAAPALAIAAGAGVVLLMAGAVVTHVRADDARHAPPAAVLGLAAIAAIVLRVTSA